MIELNRSNKVALDLLKEEKQKTNILEQVSVIMIIFYYSLSKTIGFYVIVIDTSISI